MFYIFSSLADIGTHVIDHLLLHNGHSDHILKYYSMRDGLIDYFTRHIFLH